MMFTLYNSSSSAGPVLTANFQIDFFDGVTFAALGSYTVNINFGGGLPAGWYTVGVNPADPGYRLSVVTAPVPTEKSSWGALKNLYR